MRILLGGVKRSLGVGTLALTYEDVLDKTQENGLWREGGGGREGS